MKNILLALLLLGGCSWRHRDFEKDLDQGSDVKPEIEVKDERLKEKFEVQEVPAEESRPSPEKVSMAELETKQTPARPKARVPVTKSAAKKAAPTKKSRPKIEKTSLPGDYPPEVLALSKKSKAVWDQYKPNHLVDEKVYLDIHYLGMTVGKIMFTNKGKKMINDREVWHFHARFKSAPFYSNIYELDDTIDTYVTTDQFLSVRYSLIQRETKQNVDDLQLHDRDQLKTFWFYKREKPDGSVREKEEEKYIPFYSIDPFSVLFFYQGLPLKNGDVYEIPVINKTKILILKSVVEGRETISTDLGKRKAIRVHATTQYTGETLKSGDLYFWFSDDERRTLLKARAKIKIGSVTADIVK